MISDEVFRGGATVLLRFAARGFDQFP